MIIEKEVRASFAKRINKNNERLFLDGNDKFLKI